VDIKTIIAISGILSVILAVIGGNAIKTNWFELGPLDKRTRGALGATGAILIMLLLYFFLFPELNNSNSNVNSTQTAFSLTQISFGVSQNDFFLTQTALAGNILPPVTIATPVATNPGSVSVPDLATITPTTTITPSSTTFSPLTQQAEFLPVEYCVTFYSVLVKTGPSDYYDKKSILVNPNNLSDPACLLFDLRLPDSSWIRIAPKQSDSAYAEYATGWIRSDQVGVTNFDNLKIYIPDSVLSGEYCTTSRNGVKIRSCPNDSCETKSILPLGACLIFDARTADNKWARISKNQTDNNYLPFAGYWVNSYFVSPPEFSQTYNPFILFYLGLLQVVTPIPTPEG